eukprot:1925385-Alexandrium_andersonii.AAC.1
MSASLVGSEMCIRDSAPAVLRTEGAGGLHQRVAEEMEAEEPRGRRRRCPVSYTHLTLPTICSV